MYNISLRVLFQKAGLYRTKHEDESLKISDTQQEDLVPIGKFTHKKTDILSARPGFIQYRENISNFQEQLAECRLVSLGKS